MIDFKEKVIEILSDKIKDIPKEDIIKDIELPPSFEMGDFAFPVFSLAKKYKKNPVLIAKEISDSINSEYFDKVESKSAYINFFINNKMLCEEIFEEAREKTDEFGKRNIGEGKNVVVEYSSPNIAKPFHIGHIRTTIIGDSLKRIFKYLGYNTISINHLGDYGTQFGLLIVAIKKWGDMEVISKNPIPELLKLYVKVNKEIETDSKIADEARHWFTKLENGNKEAYDLWSWIREISLKEFNGVYDLLDIKFDSYAGESFYSDKMPAIVERLNDMHILKESQGAQIIDLEKEGLPPALIMKSDGSTLYITRDIAAAKYRYDTYNFYKSIYVVGSQQKLHFQQLKAILKELDFSWYKDVEHVEFGTVRLESGTLSTRRGRVVYLKDVLKRATDGILEILNERELETKINIENKEELSKVIGIGAIKFQELFSPRRKDYTFNWDKTLSFDGETGPYVQYVHARISSLLKKGNFNIDNKVDCSILTTEYEKALLEHLYRFSETVINSSIKYEPYFITRYITELAKLFNKYYTKVQIIGEDEIETNTRLMLCYVIKNVIKEGLYLLGIGAPDKM